jgi:hypothetical protein
MKRRAFAVASALVGFLIVIAPGEGLAQTENVLRYQQEAGGQVVQSLYISHEEFRAVTIHGPGGSSLLHELRAVASLSVVTRRLGEPRSIERNDDAEDKSFFASFHYGGGTTLQYNGLEDGNVVLRRIELKSPDWGLEVGEKVLRPGMNINQLSTAVRQSLEEETPNASLETGASTNIVLAKPGAKATGTGNAKLVQDGRENLLVRVDREAGTVKEIEYVRLPVPP